MDENYDPESQEEYEKMVKELLIMKEVIGNMVIYMNLIKQANSKEEIELYIQELENTEKKSL